MRGWVLVRDAFSSLKNSNSICHLVLTVLVFLSLLPFDNHLFPCLPGLYARANLVLSARGNLIGLHNSPVDPQFLSSPFPKIQSDCLCYAFVCPFVHSVVQCRNLSIVLACHLLFGFHGVSHPTTQGAYSLWNSSGDARIVELLTSSHCPPCLSLFTFVNIRLRQCACRVKCITVHLWKMFICLQTAEYLQSNPAFSAMDMLQYIR